MIDNTNPKNPTGNTEMKTSQLKTNPCCVSCSIAIVVLISEGGLPCFHGNGSKLGAALLNGFKEETEKPGWTNNHTKCKTEKMTLVLGYFLMDSGTGETNTHTHLVSM